jgi:hypothetical protein
VVGSGDSLCSIASRSCIICSACLGVRSTFDRIELILEIAWLAWPGVKLAVFVRVVTAVTVWGTVIVGAAPVGPASPVVVFITLTTDAGRLTLGVTDTVAGAAGEGADVVPDGMVMPLSPNEFPGMTGTLPALAVVKGKSANMRI